MPKAKVTPQELISKTALKERGWTDSLIAKFFPIPTKERINMRYKSGPKVKLYDLAEVMRIELNDEFQAAKIKSDKRSDSSKKAAERLREQTEQWANSLPVPDIPRYEKDELRHRACQSYNAFSSERGRDRFANPDLSDEEFLNRITVNFLRHELSPYETRLFVTRGRVGAAYARFVIKNTILDAISNTYSFLIGECANQQS